MDNLDEALFDRNLLEVSADAEYIKLCETFKGEDEEFYKGVRFTLAYLRSCETKQSERTYDNKNI
ncbi:hypothetical protein [Acinetobacter nosocomialis]|uniref:hypothetical protein n=1 Tax=Acinetobacter nosocomialis TaxID=106654 RepID=UPI000E6AD481|nr:hypothetical protein [Acinetobacter nosocomialis]